MELEQLYQMLELPLAVVNELDSYERSKTCTLENQVKEMLLHRDSWEEGVKEHYRVHGQYKFVWAWWFPRQLALTYRL